ncbi:hypothetical protein HD806DRAFT_523822 [Xylariaceae sp. AK1471]|nr:hypothetical protein HD806DRAFT_523822 [Xylariaceae sp. AK1471]
MGVGALGAPLESTNATTFMNNLPSPTNRSNDWIFFTLGLLMNAAMPVKHVQMSEKGYLPNKWYLTPSSKARDTINANVNNKDVYQMPRTLHLHGIASPDRIRPPNILFDPFKGNMALVMNPSQMDYIVVATKILDHLKVTGAVVSRSWFNEIWNLIQRLYRDRVQLSNAYPRTHASMWASNWGFLIPEYPHEGSDWMQWNPARQDWGLVS